MKTVIISQARMTSTRLPGKVLKEAGGAPMLAYHVHRLQSAGLPVIVATTTNHTDDPIVDWCKTNKIGYHRGDEADVLSRYHGAAQQYEADVIVRVTSDCPLIDGALVAQGVRTYLEQANSGLFLSNTLQPTFPRGLDYAVFSRSMLEEAMAHAHTPYEREHVTPYFRQNPDRFDHHNIERIPNASDIRITLDTAEDYELIRILIEQYQAGDLSVDEIIHIFEENPQLKNINKSVIQKP